MRRADGRSYDQLRPVCITPGYQVYAEGSALIELGQTRVLCSASVENGVPAFLRATGTGWITAEYSMLPRATLTRSERDSTRGRIAGRSQEIQRFIGRSMRAAVDLAELGEKTVYLDCDVIQADGGTRTAAVTGGYVALHQALETMADMGVIPSLPLHCAVAAVSVGVSHGQRLLDLCYDEDFNAEVDFNVVMTSRGEFVEVQGTAEHRPFSKETMDFLLSLAGKGIEELFRVQKTAIQAARRR